MGMQHTARERGERGMCERGFESRIVVGIFMTCPRAP